MENLDYIIATYVFKKKIEAKEKKEVIDKMIKNGFSIEKQTNKKIAFIKFI